MISEAMRAVLELLRDGRWHDWQGQARSTTLAYLEQHGFVETRTAYPGSVMQSRITNTGYAELIR